MKRVLLFLFLSVISTQSFATLTCQQLLHAEEISIDVNTEIGAEDKYDKDILWANTINGVFRGFINGKVEAYFELNESIQPIFIQNLMTKIESEKNFGTFIDSILQDAVEICYDEPSYGAYDAIRLSLNSIMTAEALN